MSFLEGKKTYIGIFVAAVPTLAGFFGVDMSIEGANEIGGLVGQLADSVTEIIVSVGALFAIYGRYAAK